MHRLLSRVMRALTLCSGLWLGGCGYYFPGFEGPFGLHSYIHDIPVDRITTELQCELRDFLSDPQYQDVLDPDQPAAVTISFSTDQSGTIQYIGIDLKKLGLTSLANLISVSGKAPSLQAKLQVKGSASSQLDLAIPQTIKSRSVKPKYVVDPDTGRITLSRAATIKGLESVKNCDVGHALLASLSLKSWMVRFFDKLARDHDNTDAVCMTKITLKTSFVLAFDVSAGVNPLGPAFILPVNGETLDLNPSATQNLQIAFNLKRYKDKDLCTKVPDTQPHRVIL
jgi:hypothetical protein